MGSLWFQNMIGYGLSEDEFTDIPNPKLELLLHITHRAVQVSSFMGAIIVAPLVTLKKGPRTFNSFAKRSAAYAAYGTVPGAVLGPVLMYCRMRNSSMDGYYDRCYRLRKNRKQVLVDRMSYTGILVGGVAGILGYSNLFRSAAIGMLTGTLTAAAYNWTAV